MRCILYFPIVAALLLIPATAATGQIGADVTAPAALNTNAAADTGNENYPRIASDGTGTVVAVWQSYEDIAGVGTDGDLFYATSGDRGTSWTDPAPLNTDATTDSEADTDHAVATDGAGTWVAIWKKGSFSFPPPPTTPVFSRSTNNGLSWSTPLSLGPPAFSRTKTALATDGGGNWIAAWVVEPNDIVVSRSSDNGETWLAPEPAYTTDAPGDVALAADGASTWLLAVTEGVGGFDSVMVLRSTDNGQSWQGPSIVSEDQEIPSAHLSVTSFLPGRWIIAWDENSFGDVDVFAARSADDGSTWDLPTPINSGAANDSTSDHYPTVLTDRRGNIVALWEQRPDFFGPGEVVVARSNNGRNWTNPTTLSSASGFSNTLGSVATDGRGNWVAAWRSDDDLGGAIGSDADVLAARWHFCELRLVQAASTELLFLPSAPPPTFQVASGQLSRLLSTQGFGDVECLGTFGSSPGTDSGADPEVGEAHYYLSRGVSVCSQFGYGSVGNPRSAVDANSPCP